MLDNPFFSIITSSLNRESLKRCCESINSQSFTNFEHIVVFDGIFQGIDTGCRRHKTIVTRATRQWGNYQRHSAWRYTSGTYLLYCDDDNTLANPHALKDIADRLELSRNPAWAIFPIHRHGSIFLHDPPGMCMTDTANMVVKREFGQWPNTEAREADGMLADRLKAEHPYVAFPSCPPIIIMEHSSNGI